MLYVIVIHNLNFAENHDLRYFDCHFLYTKLLLQFILLPLKGAKVSFFFPEVILPGRRFLPEERVKRCFSTGKNIF